MRVWCECVGVNCSLVLNEDISIVLCTTYSFLLYLLLQVTTGEILYNTDGLSDLLSLTTADMRFVECLTHTVGDENSDDTQWEGSNDWIRAQFSFYLLSMLSCSLSLGKPL